MRTHRFTLPAMLACTALIAAGCAKDPSKDAPAATVKEPAKKPEAKKEAPKKEEAAKKEEPKKEEAKPAAVAKNEAAKPAAAAQLKGKPVETTVEFVGSKVTGSHECIFRKTAGAVDAPGGDVAKATLSFEADMASVECDYKDPTDWSAKLNKHMKSPDFFDVAKFPKSTFVSTKIAPAADTTKGSHDVTGNLTMRGVTKEVTFPANVKVADGKVEASTEFSINRKDFGIVYKGKPDDLIRDGVVIKVSFKGAL